LNWHGHRLTISIDARELTEEHLEWAIRLGQEIERSKEIETLKTAVMEIASEIGATGTVTVSRRGGEHFVAVVFAPNATT
jgi:hypothetical protein